MHARDRRPRGHRYLHLYYNDNLPLLAPIRQAAAAANIAPYVEPELGLVEPTLRVLIDAGYTDRTNADPATPTPFSLITPPQNIIGAAAALPGAAKRASGTSSAVANPSRRSTHHRRIGRASPQSTRARPATLPKLARPAEAPDAADAPEVRAVRSDPPKRRSTPVASDAHGVRPTDSSQSGSQNPLVDGRGVASSTVKPAGARPSPRCSRAARRLQAAPPRRHSAVHSG